MSIRALISFCLIAAAMGVVSATPEPPAKTADAKDQEIVRLRALCTDLEMRNKDLQEQLNRLIKSNSALQSQLAAEQQRVIGRDRIPDSWKPQQFNGTTFYLIPLEAGHTK